MAIEIKPSDPVQDGLLIPESSVNPSPEMTMINVPQWCWDEACPSVVSEQSDASNNNVKNINSFFSSLCYGKESEKSPEYHVLFEEHQFLITGIQIANQNQVYPESIRISLLEANRIHLRNLIEIFQLTITNQKYSVVMRLERATPSFSQDEADDMKQKLPEQWMKAKELIKDESQKEKMCWRVIFSLICDTTDHCGQDRFKNSELKQSYIYKNNTIKYMALAIKESLDEMKEKDDKEEIEKLKQLLDLYK